jgi:hypothetical protein
MAVPPDLVVRRCALVYRHGSGRLGGELMVSSFMSGDLAAEILRLDADDQWLKTEGCRRFAPQIVGQHITTLVLRQNEILKWLQLPSWSHAVERARGYAECMKEERQRHCSCRPPAFVMFSNQN